MTVALRVGAGDQTLMHLERNPKYRAVTQCLEVCLQVNLNVMTGSVGLHRCVCYRLEAAQGMKHRE